MKHHCLLPAIAIVATVAAATSVQAQTPALIPYQGRVQTGTPAADFNGTGQFKFALMQGTTATRLWVNNGPLTADPTDFVEDADLPGVGIPVTNGLYSIMLGDTRLSKMATIPPAVFANPDVRLRVWFNDGVNGFKLLTPDQRLAPNGYLPAGTRVGGAGGDNPDTNGFQVYNPSNTANQDAILSARVAGRAAGNPYLSVAVDSEGGWAIGLDNQDSNKLKFSASGENLDFPRMTLDTSGNLSTQGDFSTGGNLSTYGNFTFPALSNHSIVVDRKAIANVDGDWLTVEAGSTQGQSGTARTGGSLHLKAGNGYNANQPGAHGGDVIISSGANWLGAIAGFPNGGDIVFNTGGANNTFPERMRIGENGNVGIGTTGKNPSGAKLIVNGGVDGSPGFGPYLNTLGGSFTPTAHGSHSISIKATGTIVSGNTFVAASDARIKTIEGPSDARADLNTLRSIEVTDYRYKDAIAQGDVPQKKVIAQQVEKVFPSAVTKITNVVPDIFKEATIKDGWIELTTDLKKGERVRLLSEKEGNVHEVLEVRDGGFRTAFKPADGKIFVYGREVNDFRTVDYEAIAMLNVSATQELARKLESKEAEVLALQKEHAALQKENAALKAELAAQASKDKAQDDQLAALAALLEKQSSAAATATAGVATAPSKR